jgi:hypothetical protein
MPLQATSGAASYDAFGGGVAAVPTYIEDVFSTWLYQGTSANQTITNGIDLSTKGGLVWCKGRPNAGYSHRLFDTARGVNNSLATDLTNAQFTQTNSVTAFNTTGFSLGSDGNGEVNFSGSTYASWTFRKQPKFFDVVTFTSGAGTQTINHNLGATPGMIIVKCTTVSDSWYVWHRSIPNNALALNTTQSTSTFTNPEYIFGNGTVVVQPTSTQFTFYAGNSGSNTYVAYIYAHNAGGFGLTGTDNVISCGSYTGNGADPGPDINLGYEAQWVLIKNASDAASWRCFDVMRGMPVGAGDAILQPNSSAAESTQDCIRPTATGFQLIGADQAGGVAYNVSGNTYIYIAIRRGPMKVPTTGTSVFGMSARSGTGANATVTGGQTDDAVLVKNRGSAVASLFSSRLTGTGYLVTSSTAAEVAAGTTILQANPWDVMDGVKVGTTSTITNASANTYINYLFKRAPSFMDVVCYTGTSANRTVTHNLGIAPEMYIVKQRSSAANNWGVYTLASGPTKNINLEGTGAAYTDTSAWNSTNPTASVFSLGTSGETNSSGQTYVAYLFATCAGVSKVGSYTGTATTKQVDCGFTAGARFVLIKRTDSTGDWYVWDTARGIIAGNDPYLLLNSTAAEVTSTDYIDTYSAGFELSSTAPAAINASGGTFIFLAIA